MKSYDAINERERERVESPSRNERPKNWKRFFLVSFFVVGLFAFAQNASAATITAAKSGNWSDPTVWTGGVLPGNLDTADSGAYIVTVDMDLTGTNAPAVMSSSIATGYFAIGSSRNIGDSTHNVAISYSGTSSGGFMRVTTGTTIIYGSITMTSSGFAVFVSGSASLTINNGTNTAIDQNTSSGQAVRWGSTGTLSITGNIVGASGTGYAIRFTTAPASATINGNITYGGTSSNFIDLSGSTLTINGSVTNSSSGSTLAPGLGTIIINGSVTNSSTGKGVYVTGSANLTIANGTDTAIDVNSSSGVTSAGVYWSSTGTLSITGNIIGASGTGVAINILTAPTLASVTGNVIYGSTGQGLIRAGAGGLTINGSITNTSSGRAISVSGSANLTVSNGTNTAIDENTSSGYGIYWDSTGTLSITGNIVGASGTGTALYIRTAPTSASLTGSVNYGSTNTSGLVQINTGSLVVSGDISKTSSGYAIGMQTSGNLIISSGTITGTSVFLSGIGSLTINGGAVTLGNANTYTGGTILNAGSLTIGKSSTGAAGNVTNGPVGTSTLTLNGGTLNSSGNYTVNNGILIAGSTNVGGINSLTLGGAISVGDNILNVTNTAGTITLNGPISGTGGITLSGTGTLTLGVDYTAGPILITDTTAIAKTFAGGGHSFGNLTVSGDNVIITGNNTISTLAVNTAGLTNGLKLASGSTQTISNLTTNGSAGNLAKLVASTTGSTATLSKSSGLISVDYMSIKDSTANGGASWNAGVNSVNVSGNSGWLFSLPPSNLTVSTDLPSLVSTSTMILNGSITVDGTASSTLRGFAWGTSSNLTTGTATTTESGTFGVSSFSTSTIVFIPNTTYYFRAYAGSSQGTTTGSILSTTTLPWNVPDAPTIGTVATSSPNKATIPFTPAGNGGSPVLYYLASSTPGNIMATSTVSPITVSGLTNGTSYTFKVYAVNAVGTSTPSSVSNAVIPNASYARSTWRTEEGATVGPQVVTNGSFADSTGWIIPTGGSISGGKATWTQSGSFRQNVTLDTDSYYEFIYTVSDYTYGAIHVQGWNERSADRYGPGTFRDIIYFPTGSSMFLINGSDTFSGSVSYISVRKITPGIANWNPRVVAITGDSIAQHQAVMNPDTYPGNTTYGFSLAQDGITPVDCALGNTTFAWALSTGIPCAIATGARTIIIHDGINDIVQGRTWDQALSDLNAIRALVTTQDLFVDEILPRTTGNDAQAATIRTWNANLDAWSAANNAHFIRSHDIMGKIRASTGLLDDLGFDTADGVHPATGGSYVLWHLWFDALEAVYGYPIKTTWTVTASTGTGGSISPAGVTNIGEGTDQTFIVTPSDSYTAEDILVDGVSVGTTSLSYTFTNVIADHTIDVSFQSQNSIPASPVSISAATSTSGQATVSFTPSSNGGSAILYYLASSTPGNFTATSTGSPIVVAGLTNGTSYTFAVYAVNALGTSTSSSDSNAVVPIGLPTAPTDVTATAGNTQVVINFSAPGSNGGSAITGYTVTSSPSGGIDTNAGGTALTHTVTSLTNGISYTFTVTATNVVGTGSASSPSSSVTPSTVAAVSTNVVTSIASTSATVSGSITSTGGSDASQHGFAYGTVANLSTVTATTTLGSQTGTGTFTSFVTGLTANTTYYVRAYAVNASGTTTGSIISFLTLPAIPTVTTQAPTAGSGIYFTANGNITATAVNATVRGFVYGTTNTYGATTTENGSFTTGAYTATISGLACNTLYHVKSYALNTGGTGYGSDQTITTDVCTKPTVATSTPTGITTTGATLNGSITADNNASSTVEGFNWGNDTNYGQTASTNGTFGTGSFSQTLSGLTCNATYHYQVFATNYAGQGTSGDEIFSTSACSVTPTPAVQSSSSGGGGSASSRVNNLIAMGNYTLAQQIAKQFGIIILTQSLLKENLPVSKSSQTFTKTLKLGMTNSDVKRLQIFLNTQGFIVAKQGAGSLGHETMYFGQATKAALKKFQLAYRKEILDPQGLKSPTGLFASGSMKVANGLLK
ncbi:MAG: fibronectin type III domain-containing protein [Candidatus Taylorbacteria bacterium]